jgi:rare lipoprotein A
MQKLLFCYIGSFFFAQTAELSTRFTRATKSATESVSEKSKVYFGIASYYAEKFNGRQTANGEVYDGKKFTAACNVLPLGTWIRVTNMKNRKSVIVKTNDRLHARMTRIVDLSRIAAERLGYISRGLTQVRVEVLEKYRPLVDSL